MEQRELLQEELSSIDIQIDDIVVQMMEKYGTFLSYKDAKDKNDSYKEVLVRNYNYLMNRKDNIIRQINSNY